MEKRIRIEKNCSFCGNSFVAQKTTTSYCSHACAAKAYKHRKREERIAEVTSVTKQIRSVDERLLSRPFLSPTECAELLGVSRATIYRYLKNNELKCVQFSGKTKIRRSDINELFDAPTPYKARPILLNKPITELYSIQEIKDKYQVKEGRIFKVVKDNAIPKILKMGKSYFSKYHVDKAFAYKKIDESITEWYTVADIQEKFNMTTNAVYTFVYDNSIPKKRIGRNTFYSQRDVDKAKGIETGVEYYSVQEAMKRYNLTRDTIYHYIKAYNISKVRNGRYIKIQKDELDKLFENIIL